MTPGTLARVIDRKRVEEAVLGNLSRAIGRGDDPAEAERLRGEWRTAKAATRAAAGWGKVVHLAERRGKR